ncbi:MAG: hypothetical protein LUH58_04885 [Lachnospiraceae bacterium]|nr:hypothetical protein [Lachnospiraceae bacterium]
MKKNWNSIQADDHIQEELERQIEELAASYTPEWRFERENPDIGSILAKVFAGQMAGNIVRYGQVLDKYRTEFVNLLGISLLPARPAKATVVMNLAQDTVPGVEVRRGAKLLADSEDYDGQLIFETLHDLYVTNASLDCAFMTQKKDEKIIPLKGSFFPPRIVEEDSPAEAVAENGEEVQDEPVFPKSELRPFYLFGSEEKGIGQHALIFYHTWALDLENDSLYLKLRGARTLTEGVRRGAFAFYYFGEKGLFPVEQVEVLEDGETVRLQKEKENKKVELDGHEYSLLALCAREPVRDAYTVSEILVSSSGSDQPAQYTNNGIEDLNEENFLPFGETLSLYQECYIGHDLYFSKAGARITISFDLSFHEHRILSAPRGEEDNSLKIIKKKPRVFLADTAADARAEEISIEYFNGLGWKKLNCDTENRNLFAGDTNAHCEITFTCPHDWENSGTGSFAGRCIRIRLLKADNCYMVPCVHHCPRMEHLRISFTYQNTWMPAERLISISGTRRIDLTPKIRTGEEFTAFSGGQYEDDALYLGFDRKMEKGPVGLLFEIDDHARFQGIRCKFSYYSPQGFQQMKVIDQTFGMSRSGIVRFLPPSDMSRTTLEGRQAYWIRVSPADGEENRITGEPPLIRGICLNAVETANVETMDEENFYLAETTPNMEVNLGVSHILDVELWVNEKDTLSHPMMQRMLREMPDEVRAEYDMLGEFSSFYVRWKETDRLDFPESRRCYVLDRMNSRLIFGDGIHADFPRVTTDVSFRTIIRRCAGGDGNVEEGQINDSMGNLMFVGEINNPVKAYGGSSMETLERALKRGAGILKSRRRLVSMDDYIQEIQNYSDLIAQVKGVVGWNGDGRRSDQALCFLILMKDYAVGSYSFHNLSGQLKKHLQEACELTIEPENLYLAEPVYARVSVRLWLRIPQMDDSFETQNLFLETLEQYLDPVTGDSGEGWQIGVLPRRVQLLMRLNTLRSRAIVRKMAATVSWQDRQGSHETDLDSAPENPFFICRSGEHRIHVMIQDEEGTEC